MTLEGRDDRAGLFWHRAGLGRAGLIFVKPGWAEFEYFLGRMGQGIGSMHSIIQIRIKKLPRSIYQLLARIMCEDLVTLATPKRLLLSMVPLVFRQVTRLLRK